MNLLLISIHYPPFKSSCAVQMRDLAEQFLLEGHSPTVIIPDERIKTEWTKETQNGIKIYRLSSPRISDINFFRRAINEIFLSIFMIKALKKTDLDINSFNGVIWYSPTIFFGPLIWYIKRKTKIKSYLILRDIFPEWTLDLGLMKKSLIYYFFKAMAHFQYYVADTIGVQSESNLKYFSNYKKKRKNIKIEVLDNWLTNKVHKKSSIKIDQTKLKGRKIFIYCGNMGVAQGMDVILELAALYNNDETKGFLFVGRGSEVKRLKSIAKIKTLKNIIFFDAIDSSELHDLLEKCHVGIVALDFRHKGHNIPGKFLTYIHSGLPVLAKINKNTDLEKIINFYNVGKIYTGSNLENFYNCSKNLIEDEKERLILSKNCINLSDKMFSSSNAAKKILETFLGEVSSL